MWRAFIAIVTAVGGAIGSAFAARDGIKQYREAKAAGKKWDFND